MYSVKDAFMKWNDSGTTMANEYAAFVAGWKANEEDGDINYELGCLKSVLAYYEGCPATDDEFGEWINSKIETELWSGNYNRATRDEFIAHRVWLYYKNKGGVT